MQFAVFHLGLAPAEQQKHMAGWEKRGKPVCVKKQATLKVCPEPPQPFFQAFLKTNQKRHTVGLNDSKNIKQVFNPQISVQIGYI